MAYIRYAVINMNVLKAVIRVALYLALGDSITTGYGVERLLSFPSLYGVFLKRDTLDLDVQNLGINGLTTHGLLQLLQSNSRLRYLVSQASLITITIGSNDLLHLVKENNQSYVHSQVSMILVSMDKCLAQVGEIVRRLNPNAIVKVATLYNPSPAGPYAQYTAQVQGGIDSANTLIIKWAKRFGFVVVYLDREIRRNERSLISLDYVHPNAAGHQVIANAFARY